MPSQNLDGRFEKRGQKYGESLDTAAAKEPAAVLNAATPPAARWLVPNAPSRAQ
jgi:hypothetical protein